MSIHRTFPDGLDTEVFSFTALERAWREATSSAQREHVTPYLRTSGLFRATNIENEQRITAHEHRWTVDDRADLEFVRRIYDVFAAKLEFGLDDVLSLVESTPDLRQINRTAIRNAGYYRTLYTEAEAKAASPLPLMLSRVWFARAQQVIPGCAQTLVKATRNMSKASLPSSFNAGKDVECGMWMATNTSTTSRGSWLISWDTLTQK
jgi:hypothetical protein